MGISPDKLKNFTVLFEEFINSYPNTSKGIKHIKSYSQQRESGRRNYQAILEAKAAGEDITERVLLQLLPYRDTKNNLEQGAWIHNAPAINKNLKIWFENSRWVNPEDWHKVAELIFNFVSKCIKDQHTLSIYCQDFHRSTYSKGLQTGFMTPFLNALKPDSFILINNKSRVVINYFADTQYSHKLIDYPAINQVGWQLIKDLGSIMDRFDLPALRQDDLFDMFCHWLVAEKKYNFKAGLKKRDHNFTDSTNPTDKSDLEESKMENEKITIKIHPESYFSEKALKCIQYINNTESNAINLEYQFEVRHRFIELCNEVIFDIPLYIKNKLNLTHGYVEQEYPNIYYNIESVSNYYCDTKIGFDITFYNDSLNLCMFIDAKENCNLFKNESVSNLIKFKDKYQYLLLKFIDKTKGDSCSSQLESHELLLKRLSNQTKDNISYSGINLTTELSLEELFNSSGKELVNAIVGIFNYFYLIILLINYDNPEKEIEEHLKIWNPKYKLEKYADATYIEESQLKTWIKSITRKKQAIFYGSPGTGKTFIAENIAQYLISGGDGFYELIQFHPAYSYEDFIQGIRPQTKDNGQLLYKLVPGRFLEFCNKAAECKDKCVLVIDEINRANLPEVFGELMYLLEYRE
ncbi:MAG: AAA family ATPase, partial [Cyanobacteria bacterium P01_A01_bin.83]